MNRRHIHSEPMSKLALWARRIAGFAFIATFSPSLSCVRRPGDQTGHRDLRRGARDRGDCAARRNGSLRRDLDGGLRGMRAALAAMAISLLLLAYPAYLALKAYRLPWIYDVTTDPIDPPRYEALAVRVRAIPTRDLCRPLCRRAAAPRLSRYRAAGHQRDPQPPTGLHSPS